MAHPDFEPVAVACKPAKEPTPGPPPESIPGPVPGCKADFGVAEFAMRGRAHRAAELRGQGLHSVADSQQWNARFGNRIADGGGVLGAYRFRPARQDDSRRAKRRQPVR